MTTLVYTSARGKHIVFDDWENAYTWDDNMNDVPFVWTRMCASCHKKYRGILGNRCDCGGSGTGLVLSKAVSRWQNITLTLMLTR